jgi:hypothetical protein
VLVKACNCEADMALSCKPPQLLNWLEDSNWI